MQATKRHTATPSQSDVNKEKKRADSQYCLTQMPFDILQSICSELEPVDLLQLLRVSWGFHHFLWLETTGHVWRMAYGNLPLSPEEPPPCPLGVNIIYYTNFLFGIHCQFCASRSPKQEKHDTGFVHLCSKCIKTHTIGGKDMMDHGVTRLCHFDSGVGILKVEYNLRRKEMAQATKEEALSKYLEQRQQAVEYRSRHSTLLALWRDNLTIHAKQEAARIFRLRGEGICDRLRREACVPQHLLGRLYYADFPHTTGECELTDDEWRHIRADTIEYLFDCSERYSRDLIKRILADRLRALDGVLQQFAATRPRIAPAAFHVVSWEPDYSALALALHKPVETFHAQIAMLPKRITQWRQETDEYLISLIPKFLRENMNPPQLDLATTFFRCYGCTEPISYPRILMHHCFLSPSPVKESSGTKTQRKGSKQVSKVIREPRALSVVDASTVFPSLSDFFGEGMYPGRDGVSFYKDASMSARKIILACGAPDTITYTEMDQEDFRVECVPCSTGRGRLVMRWTTAILHDLEKHSKRPQAQWRLVDSSKDLAKISREEIKMLKKFKNCNLPPKYCRLCDQKVYKDHVEHLVTWHLWTRDKPNALEQFYTDIDQTLAPFAVKI